MGPDAGRIERHLDAVRRLLDQDYLARADWDFALRDLASGVRSALDCSFAMVALWDEETGNWSAVTSDGETLRDAEITRAGSRSALEHVRTTGTGLLTVGEQEPSIRSESVQRLDLTTMLVAPLFFWDVSAETPTRTLGGCLYAHDAGRVEARDEADVDVLRDLARIAEPALNLLRRVQRVEADLSETRLQLRALRERTAQRFRFGGLASADEDYGRQVLRPLERVSRANKVGIVILGATGSGKTHLAEAYHHACPRAKAPFVVLDCAQVTSVETLTAELFGYAPESGYANAPRKGRPGKAALADGGTLFIDEVATLPAELQQKLLRLIERGEFTPLGGNAPQTVDLQVIAATNEDLSTRVAEGTFREDLYWRLSDVVIRLPELSERIADIEGLAKGFLKTAADRAGRETPPRLGKDALRRLQGHDWGRAGNIRGLQRTIFRSVLLADPDAGELGADDIELQEALNAPAAAAVPRGPAPPRARVRRSEELDRVIAAIEEHGYATKAAEALGISYRQLTWQLHKVGLSVRDVLAGLD